MWKLWLTMCAVSIPSAECGTATAIDVYEKKARFPSEIACVIGAQPYLIRDVKMVVGELYLKAFCIPVHPDDEAEEKK